MSTVIGTQDLHVHTSMSDGDLPLEEVVAIAAERGVMVGIADHVSTRNKQRFVATEPQLRRYIDAVSSAPVFLAAEFCWCDPFAAQMPAELMERFDYRLGSNHGFTLPDGTMGSPWWSELPAPWAERPQEVMEIMVANLCDLVRAMPVEIVAHSTFMPKAFLTLDPDPDVWWTEEREDRYIEALAGTRVALEISNRYRLPHDRVLRKAKQAGIRFALGSDGHTRQQVARLEWAIETANRIGLTDADMFVPERKRR